MTRSRNRTESGPENIGKSQAGGQGALAGAISPHGAQADVISDARLVELAVNGSEDAYEKLFESYRERVYRVAYGWCHDSQTALDLVQDVFIKAFRSLDRFRSDSSIWTWLCRIAINRCLDYARKKGRSKEISVEAPEDIAPAQGVTGSADPADEAQLRELKVAVEGAIEALSPEAKSAFTLRFFDEMSYREIAKALDCSVGTVMSRLFYARQKLKDLLGDYL